MTHNNLVFLSLTTIALFGGALAPTPTTAQSSDASVTRSVLADYEVIRGALARDDGSAVAAPARRIADTVGAASGLSGGTRSRLREAAAAAARLARVEANDLSSARQAFGALSRPLVTLVQESTALGRGIHVFECPMADGYGRWLQPTTEISNPYMGSRMLQCGRRLR